MLSYCLGYKAVFFSNLTHTKISISLPTPPLSFPGLSPLYSSHTAVSGCNKLPHNWYVAVSGRNKLPHDRYIPHSADSTLRPCAWTPRAWCGTWAGRGTQSRTCWTGGWGCPCCTPTQSCSPTGWWSLSVANGSGCPRTLRDPWKWDRKNVNISSFIHISLEIAVNRCFLLPAVFWQPTSHNPWKWDRKNINISGFHLQFIWAWGKSLFQQFTTNQH